jgi:hypothetical protein
VVRTLPKTFFRDLARANRNGAWRVEKMNEIIFGKSDAISVLTFIVLFFTLFTCVLTKRTMDKERFENTFFKLFEIWLKLLIEITTREKRYRKNWSAEKNINDVEMACSESEYSPELNEFFNLLFQILKYIKNNKIKDKMTYIDIIRPFLSQLPQEKILSLPEKYINNDDFRKYKKLFEEYFGKMPDIALPNTP